MPSKAKSASSFFAQNFQEWTNLKQINCIPYRGQLEEKVTEERNRDSNTSFKVSVIVYLLRVKCKLEGRASIYFVNWKLYRRVTTVYVQHYNKIKTDIQEEQVVCW